MKFNLCSIYLAGMWLPMLLACNPKLQDNTSPAKVNLSALSRDSLYLLVETGAGEVPQWSWLPGKNQWQTDSLPRQWDYLPALANHGKLIFNQTPSAWPALLITHHKDPGSLVTCQPLAVISLETLSATYQYILLLPADSALPTIHPTSFIDFMTRYDGVRHMLETWMIHQHGLAEVQRVQWYAESQVQAILTEEANALKK